jgi:hypothetical protein
MRWGRSVIASTVAVVMLASCGGADVEVAPRAERELQAQFEQITAAVAIADRYGARSALRDLQRSVAGFVEDGLVSEGRGAEILSAASDVAAQLTLLPAPEPSVSPSPEPTETPSPTDKPEDHGNSGEGHGQGNANGHDEDHGHGND